MKTCSIVLALACVCLLAGCGGSSSSAIRSPFAGTWQGTWTQTNAAVPTSPDYGEFVLGVGDTGDVNGTIFSVVRQLNGRVSGKISDSGTLTGSVIWPGGSTTALSATGTVTSGSSKRYVGTFSETYTDHTIQASFDVTLK